MGHFFWKEMAQIRNKRVELLAMRNVQRRIVRQRIAVFVFFCSLFFGSSLVQAAPFPDMPTTGASEITRLHRDGILLGNPDGTLKPHQQVTRAKR